MKTNKKKKRMTIIELFVTKEVSKNEFIRRKTKFYEKNFFKFVKAIESFVIFSRLSRILDFE